MEREFWLERWRSDEIGFHQSEFNARLMHYWPALALPKDTRVFVPLCGKSRDMLWLANAGHRVIGVELAATAVQTFFEMTGTPYTHRQDGPLVRYEGANFTFTAATSLR